MTTLFLHPYDSIDQGAVTLFKGGSCHDNSGRFAADPEVGKYVNYDKSDMDHQGIGNDEVTSLYVPFGYSVDLFKDSGFSGDMLTITGEMFEDTNFRMRCVELDDDWNDELSSLRVYKNR